MTGKYASLPHSPSGRVPLTSGAAAMLARLGTNRRYLCRCQEHPSGLVTMRLCASIAPRQCRPAADAVCSGQLTYGSRVNQFTEIGRSTIDQILAATRTGRASNVPVEGANDH
jgi:hypothetical protein